MFAKAPQILRTTRGLKGLSHEIDFDNYDENWQMLALIISAAVFWIFESSFR